MTASRHEHGNAHSREREHSQGHEHEHTHADGRTHSHPHAHDAEHRHEHAADMPPAPSQQGDGQEAGTARPEPQGDEDR